MARALVLMLAVFLIASPAVSIAGADEAPAVRLPAPATDADFPPGDLAKEELGRLLFFDKILSGNQNISCATCHHPLTATTDWLSLPVGEGGVGLARTRSTGAGVLERVPRNAPHVFNLGAAEFRTMFHDGRVQEDAGAPGGFFSPAGADLPSGLDNALAAQAMFPVTSPTEMAGRDGDNPVADAAAAGDLPAVWGMLADRLRGIDGYVERFVAAFDDVGAAEDITFVHAANAIGAFEAAAFRADRSPFDRYLRGDRNAMTVDARRGMRLFYGRAQCSGCHAGVFQTDHRFHAIGVPQIGPGKGDNLPGYDDGLDDFGRERVSGLEQDRFRFRTPTLRNVVATGPWGHDGAYNDLAAMVRHHLDPWSALDSYDPAQTVLPPDDVLAPTDFACYEDPVRRAAVMSAIEIEPVALDTRELADLLAFLEALTDRGFHGLRDAIPMEVPSGIPVAE